MKPIRTYSLPSRLMRSREARLTAAISGKKLGKLEVIGILAQIFLAMVAIFGYFYTVRPVFQKEQLAEQVAEYDGIIRKQTPKIKEIEAQLHALHQERANLTSALQRDRARMSGELKGLEQKLIAAQNAKQSIESQVEFMAYRYRTPDGAPAITREQVQLAQRLDLRRGVLNAISTSCMLGFPAGAFSRYRYAQRDPKNPSWLFTDTELSEWKEHGEKFPLKRATECIEAAVSRFTSNQSVGAFAGEIEAIRKEALQYAERAAADKPWIPPVHPADVLQAFVNRL